MRNTKDRLTLPPISAAFSAYDMRHLRLVSKCLSRHLFTNNSYTLNMEGFLRFQAPQAPTKVTGIQPATSPPPQCYQSGIGTSNTNPFIHNCLLKKQDSMLVSKDCLFTPDIGIHNLLSNKWASPIMTEDCLFLEQVFNSNPFVIPMDDNKFIVYPSQTSEWPKDYQ